MASQPTTTHVQTDVATIGERVRRFREARGWSQNELGRLSGVNVAQVNRLEQGKVRSSPHWHTIEKLALALRVSMEDLTGLPGAELSPQSQEAFFGRLLVDMSPKDRDECVEFAVWRRQRELADKARDSRSFSPADDRRVLAGVS